MKPPRPISKWKSPPEDVVKINSDGAIRIDRGMAATGIVARGSASFLGAAGKVYRGIEDPLIVEALALRDAFFYSVERNFGQVIFEVDCAVLLRHWTDRATDRSVIKPILDEISEIGLALFSFSIVFARREANQVAHCCAKYASIQEVSSTWDAEPPAFLVHSLGADCNSVLVN